MKPKYNTSKLRNTQLGASLVTAITICLGGSASATVWDGDVSADWNTNTNWAGDAGNAGNANIRTSPTSNPPYVAKISADATQPIVDIFVADTASTGRLDHTAGTAGTGNNNWMFVGVANSAANGTYNLANTSGTGGAFTGFSTGSGTMNVGGAATGSGRLYVGGRDNGGGGTGVANINTSGTLKIGNDLVVGASGGNGTVNLDAGTVTTNGWNFFGTYFGATGGTGKLRMSGGTLTNGTTNGAGCRTYIGLGNSTGSIEITGGVYNNNKSGNDTQFIVGANNLANATTPTLTMTGGTINAGRLFTVGGTEAFGGNGGETGAGKGSLTISNASALLNVTGELWVGQGTNSVGAVALSAGTITQDSWLAVGRGGGTGTVNMTGGTWNKNGGGAFIIGASGPGTWTQSAGTTNVNAGDTWVGENSDATVTLSGSATFSAGYLQVARNGGTSSLTLNGGTLNVNRIDGGGGTETVSFNGTQINATGNQAAFFSNLATAQIQAGGLLVNSGAFTLSSTQIIAGSAGNVVKTGTGKLSLLGANTYTGSNIISAGQLELSAAGTGTGAITLSNGTALGVAAAGPTAKLSSTAGTFGTGNSINLNRGDVAGTNPSVPLLDFNSGTLSLAGNVTVNVAGAKFQAAPLPLIAYNASTRTGVGTFVLGTLPNGVVATIVDNPNFFGPNQGLVSLSITSVALPEWDGTNAPKYAKTGNVANGSVDVTVTDATNIAIGQKAYGPGIATGATVTFINANVITLDLPSTGDFTAAALKFTAGVGTNDGVWDVNTTANWVDQVTNAIAVYQNPNPVLFSDKATGPTAVTLNATVTPSDVVFNNSTLDYGLSGGGKISGTSSLTKSGTKALALNTTNDYTGVTTLAGGETTVNTALTNGGVASAIGAATGTASNLVFAGGKLNYTGPAVSINRGFNVSNATGDAFSTLALASDVTTTGQVTNGPLARVAKEGVGVLTINNALANTLATGGGGAIPGTYRVDGGGLVLKGGGTFAATGEFWVGSTGVSGASLVVDGSTLNTNTWLSVGRGNGNTGLTSTAEFKNGSTITTGGFSAGFDGGVVGHLATQTVTFAGSTLTTGTANLGESGGTTATINLTGASSVTSGDTNVGINNGASCTLNIGGTSTYTSLNRMFIGNNAGSTGLVTVSDSGTLNKNGGWFSIGGSGTGTLTVKNSGTVNSNGDFNVGDVNAAVGTLNLENSGKVISTGPVFIGKNGTTGTVNMSGSSTLNSGDTNVAGGTGSHGNLNISGGTYTSGGRLQVGPAAGSVGNVLIEGSGHMVVNSYVSVGFAGGGGMTLRNGGTFSNTDDFSVNENGDSAVTVEVQDQANLSVVRTIFVGRGTGKVGTLNVSGTTSSVNQTDAGYSIQVGAAGTGTLNISGSAAVSSVGTAGVVITNNATGTGTINLNGGSLTALKVSDGGGTSAIYFNGGTLRAGAGANAAFLSLVDTLQIKSGGAIIDTNGQNITIGQGFSNDGSNGNFTKTGAGTLFLNGTVSVNGSSSISAGTISGVASFQGTLNVNGTSTLNPGNATPGTINATTVNFASTATMAVDVAATSDKLIADDLNLNGATLVVNGSPSQPVYIIADYANLTGQFAGGLNPPGLPSGYTINYAYNDAGSTTIALIQTATPYTAWASAKITAVDPLADASPAGDPDKDGQSNLAEFGLNGDPMSGTNSGKVVSKIANVGGVPSLVLSLPVRGPSAVSPTFSGSDQKVSAVTDGIVYHAQGGINLASWGATVTEVTGADKTAIETGLPALESGWFYRTFTTGAVSGSSKDFMRAVIEQP